MLHTIILEVIVQELEKKYIHQLQVVGMTMELRIGQILLQFQMEDYLTLLGFQDIW